MDPEECPACGTHGVHAADCPRGPVFSHAAEPDYKHLLSGLLAVLHRDGGHFELKYGTARAVSAAIDNWVKHRLNEERVVTWEEIVKVCDSEHSKMDLALKLRGLGFWIEGLPDLF